jgi:hypothetical protein
MNWTYYLFILIGLCAVLFSVYTIKKRTSKESFTGETDTNEAGGASAGGAGGANASAGGGGENNSVNPPEYIENIMKLPKASTLKFYLTSFSDKTLSGVYPYSPEDARWYDFVQENVYFRLINGELPGSIRTTTQVSLGLPLKRMKMIGPASHATCGDTSSTELESFSVILFGKFNSLTFEDGRPKILFQMFAENPNHVQWTITNKNDTTCYMNVTLGNVNNIYRWEVPKTTIMSNGNPTLYALVFEKQANSRKITVYIGTNKYSLGSTDLVPIRLGNTPLEINSETNLDFNVKVFGYFNSILAQEDIPAWTEYFVAQAGGLARTLNFLQDTLNKEILTLTNQVKIQTNSVDDLKNELAKCKEKLPALIPSVESKKQQWHIDFEGTSEVSAKDMEKCSALSVTPLWTTNDTNTKDSPEEDTKDTKKDKKHSKKDDDLTIRSPIPK